MSLMDLEIFQPCGRQPGLTGRGEVGLVMSMAFMLLTTQINVSNDLEVSLSSCSNMALNFWPSSPWNGIPHWHSPWAVCLFWGGNLCLSMNRVVYQEGKGQPCLLTFSTTMVEVDPPCHLLGGIYWCCCRGGGVEATPTQTPKRGGPLHSYGLSRGILRWFVGLGRGLAMGG